MKCIDCNREMTSTHTHSCTLKTITLRGKTYNRDATYYDINTRCHDCNIVNRRGNIHHLGCDIERCPRCTGQLLSCGCQEEGRE